MVSQSTTLTVPQNRIYFFILVFAVCTLATWALGLSNAKYTQQAFIAFDNGFPGDIDLWQRAGDWSNVEFSDEKIKVNRTTDNTSFAKREFALPESSGKNSARLRVTGTIDTETYVEDSSDDPGAALMVWIQDSNEEVIKYSTISDLSGQLDQFKAERIVSIPADAVAVSLVLNSRESTSGYSLTDASLETITITPLYIGCISILILAWLLIFGIASYWVYKNLATKIAIAALTLLAGTVAGVLMPEGIAIPYINPLLEFLGTSFAHSDHALTEFAYKIGHFVFFFFVSLLFMLNSSSLPISKIQILLLMLLLAIATEGMQLHLFNRTTRLSDLGIDTSAIVFGWVISSIITSLKNRNQIGQ